MGNQEFDLVLNRLDDIVAAVKKFPESAQGAACTGLIEILASGTSRTQEPHDLTAKSIGNGKLAAVSQSQPVNGSNQKSTERDAPDWDYRSELIALSKRDSLDLKVLSNPEYAAVVAFVRKFSSPEDFDEVDISVVHVFDAWRAVGRKLPTRPRDPLNAAVKKSLLDKVKGKRGCFYLSPIGENLVSELLHRLEENNE
ncbi:MAG: hypothetical protein OXG84_14360 [Chloroflexi bacterium]|nr:hypothetical protein [Chloroflexota bacterium]